MLTGSATIESRNASVALNSGTKGTVSHKPSEKGFHLRYISQGLKRSSSIEGHRKSEQQLANERQSHNGAQRQVNLTSHYNASSKEQVLLLPSQSSLIDNPNPPLEQRTLQSIVNQRRIGGVSQNKLPSQQKPATGDLLVQRSLQVQSNPKSITVENQGSQNQRMGATMTFPVASEYGVVVGSKPDQGRFSLPANVNTTELNRSKKNSTKMTAQTAKGIQERRNVPLTVNQRQSNQSNNDYFIANTQEAYMTAAKMVSGSTKIGSNSSADETPRNEDTLPTQNAPILQGSFNSMPKSYNLLAAMEQADKSLSHLFAGRADKMQFKQSQQTQQQQVRTSFQSFQSIVQESQNLNQQSFERSLRPAQTTAVPSQRTKVTMLDSKYNVWDAPLSQKFDLKVKSDTLQHSQPTVSKSREQISLMQNITSAQGRKPDFRQSTALPKTYKQFVATVNSGLIQGNAPGQASPEKTSMYKTTSRVFKGHGEQQDYKQTAPTEQTRYNGQHLSAGSQKKVKKQKKDDVLRMINQLELGENTETFRSLAKKFYLQNLQRKSGEASAATDSSKHTLMMKSDAGRRGSAEDEQFQIATATFAQNQKQLQGTSLISKNGLSLTPAVRGSQEKLQDADISVLQRQLWQMFQLLRILKQTRYQQQLQKCQSRGDGSVPTKSPPGSQSIEYGFDMTEEEMYRRLFLNKGEKSSTDERSQKTKDENQPYASFNCPECVQMASLMLDEELKFYMQRSRSQRLKAGRSRESHQRGIASCSSKLNLGQPLKGIAGLQTQGVALKNQKLTDEDPMSFMRENQDAKSSKRNRAATHHGGKKGVAGVFDEAHVVGQIFLSRGHQQVFQKKHLNSSFRQVVRGEQMTQFIKGINVCTCRAQGANSSTRVAKVCVCGVGPQAHQQRRNFEDATIPIQYSVLNDKRSHKPKFNAKTQSTGKAGNQVGQGQEGIGNHSHNYGQGNEPKNALDGTATGHKRKYKPAIGIYQPPLQPFKHLAQSPINQVINKVNELVLILFKQKMKSSDQQIIKLFKFFGIAIPRGNGIVLDTKTIKMPDFLHAVNQKLLIKLYKVLNQENNGVKPEQSTQIFRFYVGKGNNYPSVRQILTRRTWWNRGNQKQEKFYGQKINADGDEALVSTQSAAADEPQMSSKQFGSGCHFIWTQWRKTEHHDYLKRVTMDKRRYQLAEAKKKTPRDKLDATGDQKGLKAPLANLPTLTYNRLEDNYHLSNKKALFMNVSTYFKAMGINPFEVAIPLTFNVKTVHSNDAEFARFTRAYKQFEQQREANIWIIKPGENSNRGTGIQVANNYNEIKNIIQQLASSNGNRTSIVQKYLDKPLLIHNRKFDIRGYAMLTSTNGVLKGYMYRDCYFRTSSKQFDLTNLHSRFIHLTNDAIQVNSEDYGRYESGNKLSINDFQRYLDANHGGKNLCFMRDLFPQMERLVTDSFRAVGSRIDPQRISNCFEIFGYDFMIDENFKVFLIEANTNPCLEICSPLLARIIPELLDNSFRIALDPLYQPAQFLAKLKDDAGESAPKTDAPLREPLNSASNTKDKTVVADTAKTTPAALEGDYQIASPVTKKKSEMTSSLVTSSAPASQLQSQGASKRQRLELLTQIKYTLIYDERIDRPIVDKILADYEKRQKQVQESQSSESVQPQEGAIAAQDGPGQQNFEGASNVKDEWQLLREIVEEEKLDEQAAKKQEIEAAAEEEAGIMPQPLMLMHHAIGSPVLSEDEDDDDEGTDEELFQ